MRDQRGDELQDSELFEYAARLHMLGDVERDDVLTEDEFKKLWAWMQTEEALGVGGSCKTSPSAPNISTLTSARAAQSQGDSH